MSLFGFGRRTPAAAPETVVAPDPARAAELREGALHDQLKAADHDRRKAYEAGRADERASRRRRSHPLLTALVAILVVIGVVWLVLAWRQGSFAGGGAVVDQKLSESAAPGKQALRRAADSSGDALQNAGRALEHQGDNLKNSAP